MATIEERLKNLYDIGEQSERINSQVIGKSSVNDRIAQLYAKGEQSQQIVNQQQVAERQRQAEQQQQRDALLNKNAPSGMEYVNGRLQIKEGYEADPVTGFVLPTTEKALENFESEKYILPASLLQGADQAASGITSTLDWLFGRPLQALGWENNPISALNEKLQSEKEQNRQYFAQKMEGDTSSQALSDIGAQVVAALPDALLASLTAGGSVAAQATAKGLQAASAASKAATGNKIIDAASTAASALNGMVRNPQTWLSFSRVAGPSYDQAVYDGADNVKASAYAVINGLLNTIVEIGGGGIQELPSAVRQGGNALRQWVDTMIDEGKEEAVQGVIERLTQNVVYGKGNPIYSTTDENAVLNPVTSLKEAGMGALVGGILGGGQIAINNALSGSGVDSDAYSEFLKTAGLDTDVQQNAAPAQPESVQTGAVQAAAAAPSANALDVLLSGNVTNSVAERIVTDPQLRTEFEQRSGIKLEGSKSQMRSAVRSYAEGDAGQFRPETAANDVAEADVDMPPVAPDNVQDIQQSVVDNAAPAEAAGVAAPAAGQGINPNSEVVINQEHALRGALGEQYEGPGTHRRLSNQDSMSIAQQRVNADYEGELSSLRQKEQWDAIDYDTGMLILQRLRQQSMANPEDAKARAEMLDWKRVIEKQDTLSGQSLQARSKWAEFTPEKAYADAADILYGDNVRKGMTDEQKKQILKQTEQAARALDNIAPEDAEGVISLIKQLSEQRHTTGLFRADTSAIMDYALRQVAEQSGGVEFLRNVAKAQIRNLAADYERVSFTTRLRTLRNLNMLSKAATTLRNLVGNTIFDPLESISNNTGVAFDWLLSTMTGQRTTAIDKSWFSEAKRRGSVDALMRSIVEVGLDADASGVQNRYGQGSGRTFKMSGNFIEQIFSTWEKFNGYALTSTDEFAKGGTRAEAERGLRALAERGKLVDAREAQSAQRKQGRGILPAGTVVRALDRGNFGNVVAYNADADTYTIHFESREGYTADVDLPASQVVDARAAGKKLRERLTGGRDSTAATREQLSVEDYITKRADQIAKERTFQNDSLASDFTLGLRDAANVVHAGDIGLGDVVVPFARVPANVGTQAINYSPPGLVNGIVQFAKTIRAAHNGTLTPQQQAQAVMSLGRGLAGTTGIALFAAMAAKGILKVAGADDKDEKAFDTGENVSGTQFNLSALERWIDGESTDWQDGDTLISVSFLEPINAQMAMGAMIADSYIEDGTITARDVMNASIRGTMQSIIELPAMDSIQQLQDAWLYSSGEDDTERVLNAALSYAGSQATSFVIPNALAGIAAGTDMTVRAPYLGETPEEDLMYQFMADIPDLRQNVPARLDSWGNERQYTDSAVMNFLNNTILPGSITQYRTTEVNQELRRLGAEALPQSSAPDSFTIDGNKVVLDQEQKDQYQKAYGRAALDSFEKLLESETYQQLSDQDKLKIVSSVYEYANAVAKKEINSKYKLEGASAKAEEYGDPAEYFLFNEALQTIEDTRGSNMAAFNAVMEDYENMSAQRQQALMEALGEGTRFDDVVDAYQAGIQPNQWYKAYSKWQSIGEGEGSANDKATEFANWLDSVTNYSAEQSELLQDQMIYYTMIRGNSDRYDELRDLGFTPAESIDLYEYIGEMNKLSSDTDAEGNTIPGSKKAKVIDYIDTLDLTPDEKDLIFSAFTSYKGLEDTPWHNR